MLHRNAILSVSPLFTSDYVLVIAYNTYVNHLAFSRPGDTNWTEFENRWSLLYDLLQESILSCLLGR